MSVNVQISLDSIISSRKLVAYFQPIIANKQKEVFAYEALIRVPQNTKYHSPKVLFDEATKQGRLVELELLCREISIQQFQKLQLSGKLFLNASPHTLFQPGFRAGKTLQMLKKANLSPNRVVIELTEHSPLENYDAVREALKHYKEMGFEIAMDDLGSGYSGLRMWFELRPDYVKIDRYFMCNISVDKVKQQFVLSIKNIAKELNCKVIAEGVETEDEFKYVNKLSLPYCQGFYIAKPAALPLIKVDKTIFQSTEGLLDVVDNQLPLVSGLLQDIPAITELATVEYSAKVFNQNPEWESIPVVETSYEGGARPIGLLRRNCLTQLLFSKYGRELSGKKSISALVDRNVLTLEKSLAIEQANHALNNQSKTQKALEFIITHQGYYVGIGSMMELIKMMSNLQITHARHANPLTLLPGNVPINKKLDQFIRSQSPFVIAYLDLDNFKPYNDYYGYEKGDKIITGFADILRSVVTDELGFIGHIGGDDFVIITTSKEWKMICNEIITQFSEWVRHRYLPEDQMMGGISALDRFGQKQFYPMLSLSIGCVVLPPPFCESYHDVAVLASHAKSMAKKSKGNSLYYADNLELEREGLKHNAMNSQHTIGVGYSLTA